MKDYTNYFETRMRSNGDHFKCLKDIEVPDELRFLVRKIHLNEFADSLPDDWIYEQIYFAFERLQECDSEASYWRAVNEIQADIYFNDLLEWAKKWYAQCYISDYVDEIVGTPTIEKQIELAQVRAIEAIYQNVWEFLQKNEET